MLGRPDLKHRLVTQAVNSDDLIHVLFHLINPYNKTLVETSNAAVFMATSNELTLYLEIMVVNLKGHRTKDTKFII